MEEQPVHVAPEAPTNPPAPIMDVKAPSQTADSPPTPPAAPDKQPAKTPPPPPKAPPKPPKQGVTAAIFATVIIVLGLSALAVYAYIKTK